MTKNFLPGSCLIPSHPPSPNHLPRTPLLAQRPGQVPPLVTDGVVVLQGQHLEDPVLRKKRDCQSLPLCVCQYARAQRVPNTLPGKPPTASVNNPQRVGSWSHCGGRQKGAQYNLPSQQLPDRSAGVGPRTCTASCTW